MSLGQMLDYLFAISIRAAITAMQPRLQFGILIELTRLVITQANESIGYRGNR